MKLTEMRRCLDERQIQLTKSLGQNFLHDEHQLQRIVDLAGVAATDKVLEIGPGLGPLTDVILLCANEVLVVEKDRRLVEVLEERLRDHPKLKIIAADALVWLRREPRDWSDWKMVANLPFSVASPILVELASSMNGPINITTTLQLEVARRLMAKSSDDDYGILTLLIQANYEPGEWFKIPPGCFFPSPGIDSACLILRRRPKPLFAPSLRKNYERIVKRAFSERRKMMKKLLKFDWPAPLVDLAFNTLALDPFVRAEKVSLGEFVQLTEMLSSGKV
jgi:16S rRNA (adenine1518-N6/adenine1519-N6)-dimethyltransferase